MSQGPILVADANLIPQGCKSVKNITTTTVLKATPGTVLGWSTVGTAGSAAGSINDQNTTAGLPNAATQVATIPLASPVTTPLYGIPCSTGITVVPPTGGAVAVWFV